MKSARRKRFEDDTFPHLEALWRTALWLTLRSSHAEDLVLATMTRGYQEWHDFDDSVSEKVQLFRTLKREFFDSGIGKQRFHPATPSHLENPRLSARNNGGSPRNTPTTIKHSQLRLLSSIPHMFVKGAIARLRPHSRLMLILLYRERFSYSDIVYITELSESAMRAILARLRRLIPRYILETATRSMGRSDCPPVAGKDSGAFDRPTCAYIVEGLRKLTQP